ncbi:MAG: glycosyltransferase family 9 protein [Candidatus Kapaibacterium sp.]
MKVLIIQTAFFGDVILSLPLVQVLKEKKPHCSIDFMCIPKTSEILIGNPYINKVIIFDKHESAKGLSGFRNIISEVKNNKYDVVISIQRYTRSSIISKLSGAEKRISYDNSSLSYFYTDKVPYTQKHEIARVLDLLKPLGIVESKIIKPELFPSDVDKREVTKIFNGLGIKSKSELICIAPGSVWFTKRFPEEKFIELLNMMDKINFKFALIGGKEDMKLCENIIKKSTNNEVYSFAGKLSILQSAELIKNSSLLITNDSALLHIANAVGTKVIAMFGSTTKEFGFYPVGESDKVFEVNGLKCRPCSNHGRKSCPIHTFGCMNDISVHDIYNEVIAPKNSP